MEFCKQFNAATQKMEPGTPTPVIITAFGPHLHLRHQDAAGQLFPQEGREDRRAPRRRAGRVGKVTKAQLREIAEKKMGPERERHRRGGEDDRGLRPLDGPRGGGVGPWQAWQAPQGRRRHRRPREGLQLADAVKTVKKNATAKFDETIEIAMNLGVDPRHADQNVRGVVALPHGTGKTVRVAVFAKGAKAEEAKAAGADIVGAEDLAEKVQAGEIDFDRVHRDART
jgi:hypothetical protein